MYTQSNNRIVTKYSEFLLQQETEQVDFIPPTTIGHPPKHVNDLYSSERSIETSESDSGRESPSHEGPMTVTSEEAHQIKMGDSSAPISVAQFTSSKFSDLFTSEESHALSQRERLLASEEGSFLRDAQEKTEANEKLPSRVELELEMEENEDEGEASLNSFPTGNYKRDNDSHSTARPIPKDYTTSMGSSSLAETEVTLRRELLNNIRAMTRATFFEKIYIGHEKSADETDPGEGSDTNNNPSSTVNNEELEEFLKKVGESSDEKAFISEKGEFLVFEPQTLQQDESEEPPLLDTSPFNDLGALDKEASIKEWIQNSIHETESKNPIDEVPDSSIPASLPLKSLSIDEKEVEDNVDHEPLHYETPIPRSSSDSVLVKENAQVSPGQAPVPFSIHTGSLDSHIAHDSNRFSTMFSRVEVARASDGNEKESQVLPKTLPGGPSMELNDSRLTKQVRYPSVLPKRISPTSNEDRESKNRRFIGNLPGVLLRQNMDQWVAKILRFYVNGDEHLPHIELRFRPGRDIHSFESLLDVLSEKFKLSHGVRFVFTLDGHPIWSLEELRHESAYVASSTKKFKALNYGGEVLGTRSKETTGSKRRSRNRHPSAPSQRNPPIIRVRRERSLNGVVWGSPHQELSGNERKPTQQLQRSTIEAEKVLRAAIEESQIQSRTQIPHKQIIRIINGSDPTIQSQVMLNTRVSQEFSELIKDLGFAVRIPRTADSRMETLTGRPIQSYSQLRSHLKAGNEAFYIYNSRDNLSSATHTHRRRKEMNGPESMSKSISNPTLPTIESSLGKKFPNSIVHLSPHERSDATHRLHLPGSQMNVVKAAVSSSSLYKAEVSQRRNKSTRLTNASSIPNLHRRRKTTRERYESSNYLAQERDRSPSP